MKILITGANGYLGMLFRKSLHKQHQLVLTSRTKEQDSKVEALDVTKREAVFNQIKSVKPDIIIHAAAIANLAECEAAPELAIAVNSHGTLNIVQAANEVGARIIFISSLAASNSSIAYGRSKFIAEKYVQTTEAGFEILRLSMTFGLSPNTNNRRPFNKILNCALKGTPEIFDNYWRFQPTFTGHLLDILDCILNQPFQGRLLSVTVDKDCTMYELACDLIGSILPIPGKVYIGREETNLDTFHLIQHGLPQLTYEAMLKQMRLQLATYQIP